MIIFQEKISREFPNFRHHCEIHSSAAKRFKLSLKYDRDFNYEILANMMYLDSKLELHRVDSATNFQSLQFMATVSAIDIWQTLCLLWINIYQGHLNVITHDAGTNFSSMEFRNEIHILGMICRKVSVRVSVVDKLHLCLRYLSK